MVVLERSQALCVACNTVHESALERRDERLFFRLLCPRGEKITQISSDADLFLRLRRLAGSGPFGRFGTAGPYKFRFIEITNRCDFDCAVCYADSGPEEPATLGVTQIIRRARIARREGAWCVALTGGEPTTHPSLELVVREIRRLGLKTVLVTNGLRLSEGTDLAARLRREGVVEATIQLDSFRPGTHMRIRRNTLVAEKMKAIENAALAGIRVSLNMTVFDCNVDETGDVLRYALSRVPNLYALHINPGERVGRFELESGPMDKERLMHAVVDSGVVPGLGCESFWPFPPLGPWRLALHPDCGAFLYLLVDRGRVVPLDTIVDFPALFADLARCPQRTGPASRLLLPLLLLLRRTRPGQRAAVLRGLRGTLTGRGSSGLAMVFIGEFLKEECLDLARLRGCGGFFMTDQGPVPGCLHVTRKRHPGLGEGAL